MARPALPGGGGSAPNATGCCLRNWSIRTRIHERERTEVKLIAVTALTFSLFAPAFAQTNQTGSSSNPAGAQAPGSQSIKIMRSGSQSSRQGAAENFSGTVRVDPVRAEASATNTSPASPRPSRRAIGDFSPKLAELTDNVLYADVWERPELSKRDRSLVTVAALIAMNRPEQLRSHLARARENGVTQDELIETITHLAFYSGWPNAVTAVGVAKEVFEKK